MKIYGKGGDKGFARKSSHTNEEEIGGDYKNNMRSSKSKRRVRKKLKSPERQIHKKIVKTELNEESNIGYEDEIWDINSYEYKRYIADMENLDNLENK